MSNLEVLVNKQGEIPRAVVGYILTPADEVILGLRKRVSSDFGKNQIAGIGGKVGDVKGFEMETEEEALVREFEEEVGVTPTRFHQVGEVIFIFPNKPKWNLSTAAYIVEKWEGNPIETEVIKPQRFAKTSLPVNQMWDDNKYWVPLVLSGETVQAVFVYGDDNKTVVDMQIQKDVKF
jgi:8-oxo-dGTP diphosphatase